MLPMKLLFRSGFNLIGFAISIVLKGPGWCWCSFGVFFTSFKCKCLGATEGAKDAVPGDEPAKTSQYQDGFRALLREKTRKTILDRKVETPESNQNTVKIEHKATRSHKQSICCFHRSLFPGSIGSRHKESCQSGTNSNERADTS